MAVLIFTILLCVGWLVPEHFPPWMAFHNEAPVFAGLCIAIGFELWRDSRSEEWRIGASEVLLIALLGWVAAQYFAKVLTFGGDFWLACIYIGGILFAWALGRRWARTKERGATQFDAWETLAIGFAVGAAASSLMAITQALGQEEVWGIWLMSGRHTHRALANLAQPNQLATLLLMGLVAIVLLREQEKISKWMHLTLLILLSVGVILTQSRTAMLTITLLAVWGIWSASLCKYLNRWWVAVWAGMMWVSSSMYTSLLTALSPTVTLGQLQRENLRFLLWKQIWAGISEAPWLGYGWLQTPRVHQVGAVKIEGLEQVAYAHNLLLDLAAWFGLPLTALVLAFAANHTWRRRHKLQEVRVRLTVAWLIPLFVHAMLEFPWAYSYFLFPAAVMTGMVDQWTRTTESTRELKVSRYKFAIVLFLYIGLLGTAFRDYIFIEEDFRVARFENSGIGQTPSDYRIPEILALTHLGTVLKAMRLRAQPGMSEEEIQLLRDAAKRFSWGPLHFRLALALGLNGRPEEASMQMGLLKGLFGEKKYAEAVEDFLRTQHERYPSLAAVKLP